MITIIIIMITVVMIVHRAELSNYFSRVCLVQSSSEAGLWDKMISCGPSRPHGSIILSLYYVD